MPGIGCQQVHILACGCGVVKSYWWLWGASAWKFVAMRVAIAGVSKGAEHCPRGPFAGPPGTLPLTHSAQPLPLVCFRNTSPCDLIQACCCCTCHLHLLHQGTPLTGQTCMPLCSCAIKGMQDHAMDILCTSNVVT